MKNFKLLADRYKTLSTQGKMITWLLISIIAIIVLDCCL
jgi:hypothetical protein